MKNYVQPGNALTVPAPSGGVTSGDPVLIGSLFGIAATTADEAADVELATVGVFDLPKVAGTAASQGAVIYWDAAEAEATPDDDEGANKRIGIAVLNAADVATIVRVRLDGAAF